MTVDMFHLDLGAAIAMLINTDHLCNFRHKGLIIRV
jgi:hypothetical protein